MKKTTSFWLLTLIVTSTFSQTLNVNTYYNPTTKAITVIDAISTYTIQHSNKRKPWTQSTGTPNAGNPVEPQITVTAVNNGYDVTYTFTNGTGQPCPIGNFYISGLRLDSILYVRDFAVVGWEDTINSHDATYTTGGSVYPSNLYSPLAVFSDENYTVGISLMYPVTQYKHELFMRTQVPSSGNGGPAWELFMENNREHNGAHYYDYGDIQPGEERTYKIAVRFAYHNDQCQPWLTTVAPYKKYFNENYGYTTYNRDSTPIMGLLPAMTGRLHQTNPYGWRDNIGFDRPDLYGFESLVDYFIDKGAETEATNLMLWTPTGMYFNETSLNYTFKFTSHWAEGGEYNHEMGNASQELQRVPVSASATSEGRKLGLWWGRATTVMYDWDDPYFEILDPSNSTHTDAAFHELDSAVVTGATLIGLDKFNEVPAWHAYDWLQQMCDHAPQVKFAVEQGGADILHTLAATVYYSQTGAGHVNVHTPNPHYLANYFLPGSESWAIVSGSGSACLDEIDRVAQLGYRPVFYCDVEGGGHDYDATASWYQTNPYPDLGPDVTISVGNTIVLNAGHANAETFLWSTGATTSAITVVGTTSGIKTYSVVTTNVFDCSYSDTIAVTVKPSVSFKTDSSLGPNNYSSDEKLKVININQAENGMTINFFVSEEMDVHIYQVDINGKELDLGRNKYPAGANTVSNNFNYAQGIYIYKFISPSSVVTQKTAFIR